MRRIESEARGEFEAKLLEAVRRSSIGVRIYELQPSKGSALRLLFAQERAEGKAGDPLEVQRIEDWLLEVWRSDEKTREEEIQIEGEGTVGRVLWVRAHELETGCWSVVYEDLTGRRQAGRTFTLASRMEPSLLCTAPSPRELSHDFNNLLTVILSQCDVLLRCCNSDAMWREGVETIAIAAKRTASLTQAFFGKK